MERRMFLKTTAVTATALAAQGFLPLLAAEKKGRKGKAASAEVSLNPYTEPCAIEPVTGYLPGFSLASGAAMAGAFKANYSLVLCHGAGARSVNKVSGTIDVAFQRGRCDTVESRNGGRGPGAYGNTIRTSMQLSERLNTVSEWSLSSTVGSRKDLAFTEEGVWDGKSMTVKTKSRQQERTTTHPLIGRWALLPLIASGEFKKRQLSFDMLDDSALRSNQTLRYEGEIEIPVKQGTARLDSYVQTGQGVVPTHYLVDGKGLVQLITMTTVNWALAGAVK